MGFYERIVATIKTRWPRGKVASQDADVVFAWRHEYVVVQLGPQVDAQFGVYLHGLPAFPRMIYPGSKEPAVALCER